MESIEGFKKKTGEDFDEAIENKLFDQYTKTVLWNRKAKKGIPLTKRMSFRNKHYSIDSDLPYSSGIDEGQGSHQIIEDTRASFGVSSVDLEDFTSAQTEDVKKVINVIINNPEVLSKDGIFNNSVIRKATGLSVHYTAKAIKQLKQSIRNNYEV